MDSNQDNPSDSSQTNTDSGVTVTKNNSGARTTSLILCLLALTIYGYVIMANFGLIGKYDAQTVVVLFAYLVIGFFLGVVSGIMSLINFFKTKNSSSLIITILSFLPIFVLIGLIVFIGFAASNAAYNR